MILFLFLAILISQYAPTSEATAGVITGRVVAEDGGDMSNVNVSIHQVYAGQSNAGGVVRGWVRFQNGEAPKNLCFYVIADHKGECDECRANIHSPVSAGGQYMHEGLPPGDYELTLYAQSCGIGVMPPIAPIKQMARVANGVETRADFVVDLNKKDQ